MSRLQRLIDDDQPVEIPPIDCGHYLLDFLYEVGPVLHCGMGDVPLTHEELRAWQSNVGLSLAPWEIRILRRLSLDYLIQSQQSTKPECVPPYGPMAQRVAVAKKIDAVFG